MNINDYKNQNCECGKPQRAKPRLLTHRVSEAEAGRSVQSLLRNEMQLSGGLAARLKRVENGITLNGEKCFNSDHQGIYKVRVNAEDVERHINYQ